jgi:hypothetical protein
MIKIDTTHWHDSHTPHVYTGAAGNGAVPIVQRGRFQQPMPY